LATKNGSQLGRNHAFLGELIEKLPIGVLVLDAADKNDLRSATLLEINPAAAAFLGMRAEAAKGKAVSELALLAESNLLEQSLPVLRVGAPQDLIGIRLGAFESQRGSYWVRAFALSPNRIGYILEELGPQAAAEEAIRRTEVRFRLLVQGVKDCAILMLDPEGRVLSWNEGAERLFGYRSEEIIGKNYSIFFTFEDQVKGIPETRLSLAGEQGNAEDEGWRVRKDGSRLWVNAVVTALRDERGKVYGFAKITRDARPNLLVPTGSYMPKSVSGSTPKNGCTPWRAGCRRHKKQRGPAWPGRSTMLSGRCARRSRWTRPLLPRSCQRKNPGCEPKRNRH